ncbi:MAG TPA: CBS domain-containing protein [Microthrixaceae bacterium]|jgi:signal-transduction protein with cAMP-binding, CBS, and nucleotidyltransferase domain|nr:CBS domain-containing protein [Microthrixaceae bacterium]HQF95068.1 CBS domain-containing protein [Microthrixaceae bacterium]
MKITDALRKTGLSIGPGCTLRQAAELMECNAVGALAVVEDDRAVGVVTDRDLVRRAVARGIAPDARVDSVMSSPVVSIADDADLHDAVAVFGRKAVRRLVVERDGRFVGVLSADDLLIDLASDLAAVVRPIGAEVLFGHRDSSVPATT